MEAQKKKKEHRAGALAAAPRVHPAAGAGMEAQKKEEHRAGALAAAPRVRPEAGAGMEAQKKEEHRTGALAAAPRVRPAAGAGMEAQKKEEHRTGALAAAPRVLPAAGAGGHREGPPSRFARWLDVLGCVWRYARGFARGVGRVVFLLLGRRSPGTDGVVIERSPDHVAVVKQTGKNHAWMYGKPTVRRRDDPALAAHHDDPAHQDSGTAKALPAPPQPRAPRQLPAPADSPLMVGDEAVWGEELREFAIYCQDSLGCRKKIVCHMCVFDQHNYFGKLHAPSDMLVHCSSVHKIGYKCPKSGCMVRVATPRELPLHIHFYHELPTGWWEMTPYNEKMNVMKGD